MLSSGPWSRRLETITRALAVDEQGAGPGCRSRPRREAGEARHSVASRLAATGCALGSPPAACVARARSREPLARASPTRLEPGSQRRPPASAQQAVAELPSASRSRRRLGARRARGGVALPAVASISAWSRPRKPSASSDRQRSRGRPRPAGVRSRRARISSSLKKSGEGGSPASVPSESPIAVPSVRSVGPMPVTPWAAGARLVAEERHRGVEAERLRDRVAGDVEHDAGERERRAEADPERDHAHVLEARVGEQALPGQRSPEERDGDGERGEPERDEHAPCGPVAPTTGARRALTARRSGARRAAAPPRAAR